MIRWGLWADSKRGGEGNSGRDTYCKERVFYVSYSDITVMYAAERAFISVDFIDF